MAAPDPGITPEFRCARAEDEDTILVLMRALEDSDPGPLQFDEGRRREVFREFIEHPELGAVWLITAAGKPSGYVILTLGYSFEYGGRDAFVDELYVVPEMRGRGLGKAALTCLEQAARDYGVQAVHLEVSFENKAALEVYRRSGFRDHDRRLMTKRL
jgi:ribosomal protein S18 acetylase RimI-like enzyme